jgi:sigma-B regulation protein RsbU (phosphoserine phosphatase)
LQVLVAGLVTILVVGGVLNLGLVRSGDASLAVLVNRLDPATESVNVVESSLIDQQRAVSGFVLTGKEETLEPYQRALERTDSALRRMALALEGLPEAASIPAVQSAIDEWRRSVVEPELSAKRARHEGDARALSATGERVFQVALNRVIQLSESIQTAQLREQKEFERSRQGITRAIIANLLVAALLVLIVTTFLRRWVTRPLLELRRSVERVAGGDVHHSVEATGPAELAQLGDDIEAMRLRILREAEESRRAEEGLAQRAPTVVALRDALAPRTVRVPAGFEFASLFEPAEGVLAGDWFAVLDLAGGRTALCLGDVAGHGAEPGIFALRAKELFVAALRLGAEPAAAITVVADQLGQLDESFLTVVVALIEPSGVFRYANAGHPPPILCSAGGAVPLSVTGPLLGPLPGRWEADELVLAPGASLVCYTDGLIEAVNADRDEYGVDRLRASLEQSYSAGATAIVAHAAESLRAFTQGRSRDDITMLALTRLAREESHA